MKLTNNFTLEELCHTDTGFPNIVPECYKFNLFKMALVLQKFRSYLNYESLIDIPIFVSSCYRSSEVNQAVSGKPNSKHRKALAFDIYTPATDAICLFEYWIDFCDLHTTQLLFECLGLRNNYNYRINSNVCHFDFVEV